MSYAFLFLRREIVKVFFTIYECGGHLGPVTQISKVKLSYLPINASHAVWL